MKKYLLIGVLVAGVALALGAAGLAYAQTPAPPSPGDGAGGRGGFSGMGWRHSGGEGPLHEYMMEAFAEALGLSVEELEERRAAGETLWQIAQSQGLSQEAFAEMWQEARAAALQAAVADGVISQEQADWMIQRMAQRQGAGFGPGSAACEGSPMGGRRGPGRRSGAP